jgi:hypothetical protein
MKFQGGHLPRRREATLSELRSIAVSYVGEIEDQGTTWGYCQCPGASLHTNPDAPTDCTVAWAPTQFPGKSHISPPIVHCMHDSCKAQVDACASQLQSALGKRHPSRISRPASARLKHARKPEPVFDPAKLERVAARCDGADFDWFARRSTKRGDNRTPASFLHDVYSPGEKVVIFNRMDSQGEGVWSHTGYPFDARELDSLRTKQREGVWFLAPPVTGESVLDGKKNPDGTPHTTRRSRRTVTSFRWLVIESDKANPVHWLAFLAQLLRPIVAIYSSGGQSIHALINIGAGAEGEWNDIVGGIKPELITLGADHKMFSAVRLTRLPGCQRLGKRDKNKKYIRFPKPQLQQLIFLNPWADGTPICELPEFPEVASWAPADQDGFNVEAGGQC